MHQMALLDKVENVANGGRGRVVLYGVTGHPPADDLRPIRCKRRDTVLCLVRGGTLRPPNYTNIPGQPATTPNQLYKATPSSIHSENIVDGARLLYR